MKRTLQQKQKLVARLSEYAASAGAIIALAPNINAQIVYSGIENIQLNMPESTYALDMDEDATNDFIFQIYGVSTIRTYTDPLVYVRSGYGFGAILNARTDSYKNSWIYRNTYLTSTNYTSISGTTTYTNTYPLVNGLSAGVQIDDAQSMWTSPTSMGYANVIGYGFMYSYWGAYSGVYAYGYGDFFGQEKYIGVSFFIGTDQHYGWIRVSLGDYIDPMTIIDWAYESTPGDSIITGAGDYLGPEAILDAGVTTTQQQTINISLSFGERAYGFNLSDLNINNGSASNLTEIVPGKQYSFDVTANDGGTVTVQLPAGSVMDLSGNENELTSETWIYNAPVDLNITDAEGVRIYPNPVKNELFIELEAESSIQIIDLKGNLVFKCEPSIQKTVDMSFVNPGIYIVQIQNDQKVTQHRIVVE